MTAKDTITIIIETSNDAFTGGQFGDELAQILRGLADHAEGCASPGDMIGVTARDSNGNPVCQVFGKLRGAPAVS